MIRNREQDEQTAAALEMSYSDFVDRHRTLRRQAEAQGVRRKAFRFILPVAGKLLTRMKFTASKSRFLDRLVAGAER